MGRAQKIQAARREDRSAGIQLDELDYLRLTSARDKIDAAMLRGQQSVKAAVDAAEKDVTAAKDEFVKRLQDTATAYKFDATINHRFDDTRFLLIPEGQP